MPATPRLNRGLLALSIACALTAGAGAAPAMAAELMMFERAGCAFCQRFDREIAPRYPLTDEGRRAPLHRVDQTGAPPADVALAAPVRFAPTFVLVDGGREIGRITGYMNEETFFGLLGAMTRDLPGNAR